MMISLPTYPPLTKCKLLSIAVTAALLAVLTFIKAGAQQPNRAPQAPQQEVDGFTISISAMPTPDPFQLPIKIRVTMANTKSQFKVSASEMPEQELIFDIKDSKGEDIPLTRYGQYLRGGSVGIVWPMDGGVRVNTRANFTIPISEIYDLTVPDTYTLTVKREISKDRTGAPTYLFSNPITITAQMPIPTFA